MYMYCVYIYDTVLKDCESQALHPYDIYSHIYSYFLPLFLLFCAYPRVHKHGVVQLTVSSPSGPPDTPVLRELQANATSLYVSWEEPADNNAPILMYQITLQVMDDGVSLVFTSNITELTVTGLTPFTVYSVQVVAVNSIGSSAPNITTVMTAEGSECVCLHMHTPVPFIHYMWLCVSCYCMHCPL